MMQFQIEQDAWNVKESLAVLASTAASNSQNNVSLNSSRFVPGELTVKRVTIGHETSVVVRIF